MDRGRRRRNHCSEVVDDMRRQNPRLFAASTSSFTTRGIGTLTDAISCEVTEGRNAGFTIEIQIPVTSKHFKELRLEQIILAKPNPYDKPQAFRIHRITKPMDGVVTVLANHLSYDLRGYPVNSFIAEGAAQAVSLLKSSSVIPCPFTITTDIESSVIMTAADPHTIRDYMGGMEGSLIDKYHGEYQFDNYTVSLLQNRGRNRGVKIKYGINLIDLKQEENCASVYTGVLPYFSSENMGRVIGDVQRAPGTFEVERILPLDLTDKYDEGEEPPTVAQLNRDGAKYITDNSVGVPKVSLDLNFAQLDRKEVHLCDTVTVVFEKLNVEAEAKVIETVYDVLNDRYVSVKLGDPRANIANSLADEKAAREASGKQLRTYIEKTDKAVRLEAVARSDADTALRGTLDVHAGLIKARVTKTGANEAKSFSWSLTEDGHYWYSNKAEVMKVTSAGLEVRGKVVATSGTIGGCDIVNGVLKVASANITSINADTITAGTLNVDRISAKSIVTSKIADEAITAAKIGGGAVTNPKIGASAVSYGKTSFTGTLDQVGTNSSNIETIRGYFRGDATCDTISTRRLYLAGGACGTQSITYLTSSGERTITVVAIQ